MGDSLLTLVSLSLAMDTVEQRTRGEEANQVILPLLLLPLSHHRHYHRWVFDITRSATTTTPLLDGGDAGGDNDESTMTMRWPHVIGAAVALLLLTD